MYGQGPRLGDDWYERLPGLPMYFHDANSVKREFGPYGLIELSEIDEPAGDGVTLPFINVVCKRDAVTVNAAEAVGRLRAGQVEVTVDGPLQQSEVAAIAEALETSKTSILTMGGCKITDAGGVAIAHALLTNTALRELWLFNNEIADIGGKALAPRRSGMRSVRPLRWCGGVASRRRGQMHDLSMRVARRRRTRRRRRP